MPRVEIPNTIMKGPGTLVAVYGAAVQVNVRNGGPTTVYVAETGGETRPNPLTSDAVGRIEGWVEEGSYDLVVSKGPPQAITEYTERFEAISAAEGGFSARLGAVESSRLDNGAANLKDYAGDVVAGNWLPILQALYDAGRPIYAPEGTYDVQGPWVPGDVAPRLFGAGKGRTIFVQQGADPFFSNYRTTAGALHPSRESLSTPLTATLSPSGIVVAFATAGYAAGDYVQIKSDLQWPGSVGGVCKTGEITRIAAINSASQATLAGPIDEEYLLADNPTVAKLDLLRGLYFADFTFRSNAPGTKSGFAAGIYANYCHRPTVERVEFIGLDGIKAGFAHSVGPVASYLDCFDSGTAYGVYADAGSRGGLVHGCLFDGGNAHAFSCGSSSNEVPTRHWLISNNQATNMTARCFDTHPHGRYMDFVSNRAFDSQGYGFGSRSPDTRFVDCVTRNCGSGILGSADSPRLKIIGGEADRLNIFVEEGISSAGIGASIAGANCVVDGYRVRFSQGVGINLASISSGCTVRRTVLVNTDQALSAGSRRGISVQGDNHSLIDVSAENVDTVIDYLATATNITERGTHGKNYTDLRKVAAGATFLDFEGTSSSTGLKFQSTTADADATLTPKVSVEHRRYAGTLTVNRTLTLATATATRGDRFKIVRTGGGAFTLSVGGLKTLATNQWCEVVYTGTEWALVAFGSL